MFNLRAQKVLIKRVYMKYLRLQGTQENDRLNLKLNNLQFTYTVIIKTKEEKRKLFIYLFIYLFICARAEREMQMTPQGVQINNMS